MRWGWVKDDNIFIFGWTIPLIKRVVDIYLKSSRKEYLQMSSIDFQWWSCSLLCVACEWLCTADKGNLYPSIIKVWKKDYQYRTFFDERPVPQHWWKVGNISGCTCTFIYQHVKRKVPLKIVYSPLMRFQLCMTYFLLKKKLYFEECL